MVLIVSQRSDVVAVGAGRATAQVGHVGIGRWIGPRKTAGVEAVVLRHPESGPLLVALEADAVVICNDSERAGPGRCDFPTVAADV